MSYMPRQLLRRVEPDPIIHRPVEGTDILITWNEQHNIHEYTVPQCYACPVRREGAEYDSLLGRSHAVEISQYALSEPQPRKIEPIPMKSWTRPKAPSKLAGRKGTRRGWKRQNPPGLRDAGETRPGVRTMQGVVFASPDLIADVEKGRAARFVRARVDRIGGCLDDAIVVITLRRSQLVERYERVFGRVPIVGRLDMEWIEEEVERYVQSVAQADAIIAGYGG